MVLFPWDSVCTMYVQREELVNEILSWVFSAHHRKWGKSSFLRLWINQRISIALTFRWSLGLWVPLDWLNISWFISITTALDCPYTVQLLASSCTSTSVRESWPSQAGTELVRHYESWLHRFCWSHLYVVVQKKTCVILERHHYTNIQWCISASINTCKCVGRQLRLFG